MTADDFTTFLLRFAGGAVATVVLSVVTSHTVGPRIEVWGDEGMLVLDETERLWGAARGQTLAELTERESATPPPGLAPQEVGPRLRLVHGGRDPDRRRVV